MNNKSRRKFGRVIPRPTDISDPDVLEALLDANMGLALSVTQRSTGYSPGMIHYRLKKWGQTKDNARGRLAYRNGTSPYAQLVIRTARPVVKEELLKHLNEQFKE